MKRRESSIDADVAPRTHKNEFLYEFCQFSSIRRDINKLYLNMFYMFLLYVFQTSYKIFLVQNTDLCKTFFVFAKIKIELLR